MVVEHERDTYRIRGRLGCYQNIATSTCTFTSPELELELAHGPTAINSTDADATAPIRRRKCEFTFFHNTKLHVKKSYSAGFTRYLAWI